MSRPSTLSAKYSASSRSAICGRRNSRYVLSTVAIISDHVCLAIYLPRVLQDAQAKYRESKAELDELVQNIEGL